jgi:hypothetical protein
MSRILRWVELPGLCPDVLEALNVGIEQRPALDAPQVNNRCPESRHAVDVRVHQYLVIEPQVLIQPPGERAAHAAGAETAGQVIRAQMDAGVSPDRAGAPAESVPGGRSGRLTPASEAFDRGYDEVAGIHTREPRELEAGA